VIEYRWAEGGAEVRLRQKAAERDGAWTHVQVGAILHPFGGASAWGNL